MACEEPLPRSLHAVDAEEMLGPSSLKKMLGTHPVRFPPSLESTDVLGPCPVLSSSVALTGRQAPINRKLDIPLPPWGSGQKVPASMC